MASKGPYYDTGAYVGEIINQGLGESKTGTPYFFLKVKVLGTPDDNSYVPAAQQYERTVYFYLSEKAMEGTVENLKTLGFDGKSLSQLDLDHAQAISFVGNQIDLYCNHGEYNGEWREKWNLSRILEVQKIEPKKLRQLDALFGKSLKTAPANTAPTAAKGKGKKKGDPDPDDTLGNGPLFPGDSSDPGITDDDIPF